MTSLAEALGVEPLEVRLTALTFNFAIARYAVLTDEELTSLLGIPDPEAARQVVRLHVCDSVQPHSVRFDF